MPKTGGMLLAPQGLFRFRKIGAEGLEPSRPKSMVFKTTTSTIPPRSQRMLAQFALAKPLPGLAPGSPAGQPGTYLIVDRGLVLTFKLLPALNSGAFTGILNKLASKC